MEATRPNLSQPIAFSGTETASIAGYVLVAFLWLRWAAGIAENYGADGLSEITALAMLATTAITFLMRLRLDRVLSLFVGGLLAWVFTAVLSFTASGAANPTTSLSLVALLLLYFFFSAAAFSHFKCKVVQLALSRFLIAFILVGAVLSFLQMVTGTGFRELENLGLLRAFGSDVHPVSFGIQIVCAVCALEVIRIKAGVPARISYAVLLILAAVALYLTAARTAWVMGIIVIAFTVASRGTTTTRVIGTLAVLTFLSIVVFGTGRFADLGSLRLFTDNFSPSDMAFDYRYVDNSVSWRIVNWGFGLTQALERPVFGHGPGLSAQSSYFELEMHNIFLETFFEGGIFGLVAFLVVISGLIKIHLSLPKATEPDRKARAITNGFGIALFFATTFSTSFVDQLMSMLLYIVLLSVGYSKTSEHSP